MLKNYLVIALRNINRNRLSSMINIIGLSIGLACVFLILLHVRYEFPYDKYHKKADWIFRVVLHRIYPDTEVNYAVIPHSVGLAMADEFPEINMYKNVSGKR